MIQPVQSSRIIECFKQLIPRSKTTQIALGVLGLIALISFRKGGFQPPGFIQKVVRWIPGTNRIAHLMGRPSRRQGLLTELNRSADFNRRSLLEPGVQEVLRIAPEFSFYRINVEKAVTSAVKRALQNGETADVRLTYVSLRPVNMLFAEVGLETNMPSERSSKFSFNDPGKVRDRLEQNRDRPIEINAQRYNVQIRVLTANNSKITLDESFNGAAIYGRGTYRISGAELLRVIESQKIHLSRTMPKRFYLGLKNAMQKDGIIALPGNAGSPQRLSGRRNSFVASFLEQVRSNPENFGFQNAGQFQGLLQLTWYEIGSMVVKSEDYHLFLDGDGQMIKREVGTRDQLRLVSACGIRGFKSTQTSRDKLKEIMKETYLTALDACESGYVLFPAVGLGVWGGDPDVYWAAFIEAVLESEREFKTIFVNPGHKPTPGEYKYPTPNVNLQWDGDEFQAYMKLYLQREGSQKLSCIFNLKGESGLGKDILQLGRELKNAFPHEIVSIFNASDPDVTLGNVVGQRVNDWPCTHTTEENMSAMGSNLFNFSEINRVLEDESRIISREAL